MAGAGSEPSALETLQLSARRRSYTFLFIPVLVLFVFTALSESDQWLHALDDEIIVVTSLAILIYFVATRKLRGATDLRCINRLALVASVIVMLAGVLAVVLEFGDAQDFGDDPLTVVGGVLAVVNGLLALSLAGPKSSENAPAYATEWSRIRSTFWFASFFVVQFAMGVIPPYPAFGLGSALVFAELVAILVFAVAGLLVLLRSRAESDPRRLHGYNNLLLGVALGIAALALAQVDVFTLSFAVMLIANRCL